MSQTPTRRSHLSDVVLGVTLLILVAQVYLFETVLQSVLDGQRSPLPGAFAASLLLTVVALILAFKAPRIDDAPRA
jgi:predicted Co/Zn/Cd cation transporter (cation efflux family)